MNFVYSNSFRGFSHIKSNKPCQDYSDYLITKDRTIITCCDGHGGEVYYRSDIGSKLASDAIKYVLFNLKEKHLNDLNKVKLDVLCKWNELVENHIIENPIREEDLDFLSKEQVYRLINNPVVAYGTTLNAVMYFKDKILCLQLGDGGIYQIHNGNANEVFINDDDDVCNLTYSLCSDNAFEHLNIKLLDNDNVSIFIYTDGVSNPYQDLENFKNFFIIPVFNKIKNEEDKEFLNDFLFDLSTKIGTGDDVSFGCIVS